ncbi:hypothetical protein LX70_00581 [Defluviimonas denitrificans]|uniref:DNA polymerase-3 subunit epsilon n=2 Tax=Albidovulum denitrificans TaxID=404881 RepID=A0A2S8SDL4_9RHOB|nr:hypothetical protein LX70_00581 [Defluviimonas denitrificans]
MPGCRRTRAPAGFSEWICARHWSAVPKQNLAPYGKEGLPIMRGFVKLKEACAYFGFDMTDAHDAMADAQAARQILARLIADGRMPEAKVHYAKNRPMPADAPITAVDGAEAAE